MKKLQVLYITAFFAACLVPSLGMAVTKQEASSENRRLAEFPELKKENEINTRWLPEAGEYFQEHFAFRNELVTANALLNGKIFGVSTADGVIQGTDNWLYYKDSLEDYLGEELLSERSLFNIAHTLAMMQETLNEKGVQFLFTVAPNKNSLYGENMPYYDSLKVSSDKNLVNLQKYLRQEQVSYGDLYETLSEEKEVLYHKRDSHWNNKGAAVAAETLLSSLKKEHVSYKKEPYTIKTDFTGDLDEMLYPLATTPEEEVYYDRQTTFAYVGEVGSNFDPKITTVNPGSTGSLVMYRDSFGNAILPFFANSYASAYFSRGIPYQMTDLAEHQADTVIVERAERFLPEMAENPPQMEAPQLTVGAVMEPEMEENAQNTVTAEVQGDLVKVSGLVDEAILDTDSRIAIRRNGGDTFEAFPLTLGQEDGSSSDYGFLAYFAADSWMQDQEQIEVLIEKDGTWILVGTQSL